jgi:hypothetical protein
MPLYQGVLLQTVAQFFDAINLAKGTTFQQRCNTFIYEKDIQQKLP